MLHTRVFVSCVLFLSITLAELVELWSTEHLTDLIVSDAFGKEVPAVRPAVIALYESPCKAKLRKLFKHSFIPTTHLVTATFDRIKAKEIWYEWVPEKMDLFEYYNISTENKPIHDWCPTILFQSTNWSAPVDVYDPNSNQFLKDWVWGHLKIDVKFVNTLEEDVNVFMTYEGQQEVTNEMLLTAVSAKQEAIVPNLHSSDNIIVRNAQNELINRFILDTESHEVKIFATSNEKTLIEEEYLKKVEKRRELQQQRDWSTRRRYLNNIRSPPLMPAFTERGFDHFQLPADVCDYVKKFYAQQRANPSKEHFPKDGTQINVREVQTYMMHIPSEKKRWIGDRLRPLMEEWSGTKLKYSTIYGMREYRKGAVLKSHVDRIETHIISAILHIYHEPSLDEAPWPLELTSWDGKRYYVQDDVCSMVFYESSKLIHGRPSLYNGSAWVNAFLHYRPVDWDEQGYVFTPQNVIKTPTAEVHLVNFVYG